ncbi:NAD(P)/FAD-dependent oxidoreductase [Brucella pituitosa]|uniref:NAD(P)/FAD-dependent oxidoreductase n=1 Tax=Brucella pituitosa TaxID=571256 RepID=UPI003F4ADC92
MSVEKTLIIGAGVLGLSVAEALSRKGHAIQVLAHNDQRQAASLRSFSWLNSFGIASSSYRKLRLDGLAHYRNLLPQAEKWIAFPGSLNLIETPEKTQKLLAHHNTDNYIVEQLATDQFSKYEPHLNHEIFNGYDVLRARDDGWVDLPPFLNVLRKQIKDRGGRIDTVDGGRLSYTDGQVAGYITTAGERFSADNVVVAAGMNSPHILQSVGYELPERTNIGLIVKVRAKTPINLHHVLRTPELSLRPTARGELVLHSDSADRLVVSKDGDWTIDPVAIETLITKASSLFTGTPSLICVGKGAGPRPIPRDGLSVFGAIPNIHGLYIAFSHSAATLGPVIGELLADEISDGQISASAVDFRPDRFQRASAIQSEIKEHNQ